MEPGPMSGRSMLPPWLSGTSELIESSCGEVLSVPMCGRHGSVTRSDQCTLVASAPRRRAGAPASLPSVPSGYRPAPMETPAEDPHQAQAALAEEVRRLGHALQVHQLDPADALRLRDAISRLAAELDGAPRRDKHAEQLRVSTRYQALIAGRMPEPTEDGATIEFDRYSIVGGALNPFGLAARHRRDGDEAVTTVRFPAAFEGPPGRVHGGAVALVIDEATATVLPMIGRFGFTGSVSLRLIAPAPLDVEVEFRSRLVGEEGRKVFVHCTGQGPEGIFTEADATYIQVDPATVPWIAAARAAMAEGVAAGDLTE